MTTVPRTLRRCLAGMAAALLVLTTASLPANAEQDQTERSLAERVSAALSRHRVSENEAVIAVEIATQTLHLLSGNQILASWPVATGRGGVSNRIGSGGTPPGVHRVGTIVVARRGEVLVRRRATGRVSPISDGSRGTARITTALLTLVGQERVNTNSARRGIYIHGTNLEGSIGSPLSSGCVRMTNDAVAQLSSMVSAGTWVVVLA